MKDSFYPSKMIGLRPTFLEGLPYSLLTKWENFVNGNKIIFGCPYMSRKIHFTLKGWPPANLFRRAA